MHAKTLVNLVICIFVQKMVPFLQDIFIILAKPNSNLARILLHVQKMVLLCKALASPCTSFLPGYGDSPMFYPTNVSTI